MTLTQSETLQAKIGKMSNLEFEEWLSSFEDMREEATQQAYREGKNECKDDYSHGYDDGYSEGYENGVNEA